MKISNIFDHGDFKLISFRTMDFNIRGKVTKTKIIKDLLLIDDRDDIYNNKIDRIYKSWVVFDKMDSYIFEIAGIENGSLFAYLIYDTENNTDTIEDIKRINKNTNKSYSGLYCYKFYSIRFVDNSLCSII